MPAGAAGPAGLHQYPGAPVRRCPRRGETPGHARWRGQHADTRDGWPGAAGGFTGVRLVLCWATAAAGNPPGGQAGLSCLVSWLVISTLRGLAASCTGMARVSTPAV
jgi:hypothetical protein